MAEDLNQTSLMCCRSVLKTLCLGIYITYIWPSDHDIMVILGQWLDIAGYQDSKHSLWLTDYEYGYGNKPYHTSWFMQ